MNFSCDNVNITSIILGGEIYPSKPEMPEILIWRYITGNTGSIVETIPLDNALSENISTNLYQYDLVEPVPVQLGDIIGINQPSTFTEAGFVMYYQTHSGPDNYLMNGTMLTLQENNHYPLIQVVLGI